MSIDSYLKLEQTDKSSDHDKSLAEEQLDKPFIEETEPLIQPQFENLLKEIPVEDGPLVGFEDYPVMNYGKTEPVTKLVDETSYNMIMNALPQSLLYLGITAVFLFIFVALAKLISNLVQTGVLIKVFKDVNGTNTPYIKSNKKSKRDRLIEKTRKILAPVVGDDLGNSLSYISHHSDSNSLDTFLINLIHSNEISIDDKVRFIIDNDINKIVDEIYLGISYSNKSLLKNEESEVNKGLVRKMNIKLEEGFSKVEMDFEAYYFDIIKGKQKEIEVKVDGLMSEIELESRG